MARAVTEMMTDRSARLWAEANRVLAGGVNSPVRAFKAVGGHPFFARSGRGPRITDADGNRYIDYVLSWGPLIAGHAHPAVVEAVARALRDGSSFGIPTEAEVRLAERIIGHVPSIERLRLVNSGTEAALGAIRLARGATGRDVIVKVDGGYHGQVDSLLIKAGSGPRPSGRPRARACRPPLRPRRCPSPSTTSTRRGKRSKRTAAGSRA